MNSPFQWNIKDHNDTENNEVKYIKWIDIFMYNFTRESMNGNDFQMFVFLFCHEPRLK